jgi:hypothetical protein
VRKAPAPEGRPGFIRIDSVHQGDLDGVKGLCHIDAVNRVTPHVPNKHPQQAVGA